MSVVGPSGSGKTELIFKMLKGSTFYPKFEKIFYFYKEHQPLFPTIQKEIKAIKFLKYSGFEITKKLSDCLLVYDDCNGHAPTKEIVRLASINKLNVKRCPPVGSENNVELSSTRFKVSLFRLQLSLVTAEDYVLQHTQY